MNLEYFIAQRFYNTQKGEKRVSKPAVLIAQGGVAIGLIVMILSLCIVVGFKSGVKSKIIGFGSNLQVRNYDAGMYGEHPITITDSLLLALRDVPGVQWSQRFSLKPGLFAAGEEFQGVMFKGVGQEFDKSFISSYIKEGEFSDFSDSVSSGGLLISHSLAKKMNIVLGDRVIAYFLQDNVKARPLYIKGIYETDFAELDNALVITDIYTVNRLNDWGVDEIGGIELSTEHGAISSDVANGVIELLEKLSDIYDERYFVQTIEEVNPALFAWLDVLDGTVWIILFLVIGVAGFTMISGLLILILEKSNLIGILKALGIQNSSLKKIFFYYGMFIVGKGMVIGNIIAFILCAVQYKWEVVKLDSQMYYMDCVPIEFTWWLVPMNIIMFILSFIILIIPSLIISRISPTKAIKFE